MLAPDSRTVAFELLRPPAGYDLDFALLTTYTLDLEALLALPLSVISLGDTGIDGLLADPLLLLEALRQAGERIHVFVDQAGITPPRNARDLYALLEPSVHSVRAPGRGAFHPKVWVLRFHSEETEPLLRVAVLSRNLTYDRSWDIALASEASPSNQRVAASHPLAEFIQALPTLAREPPSPRLVSQIETLAHEVRRTRFPPPDGFFENPIKFHVLGLSRRRRHWRPATGGRCTLAVAPFVDRKGLGLVAATGGEQRTLVSRQGELDKLPDKAFAQWNEIRVLTDTAAGALEDGAGDLPPGLHAKFIAVEHGWDVTWYVGSANLTAAALGGRNIEVMASMTARKGRPGGNSGCGIERFLESGFGNLCAPYHRQEIEDEAPEVDAALKKLEAARDSILDADLKVVCAENGENWLWTLDASAVFLPDDVEVAVWPVSVAEHHARSLELPLTWPLPVQRLTRLVAFRLSVRASTVDDIRLTLSLPATGMPPNRMHQVLRTLIDNPERFLLFLRALLGGLDGMADWARSDGQAGGNGAWGDGLNADTLLEDLLRAASRDPNRLDPVRRLIEDCRKTEEGRRVIPEDFLGIWTAVDEALRGGKRS